MHEVIQDGLYKIQAEEQKKMNENRKKIPLFKQSRTQNIKDTIKLHKKRRNRSAKLSRDIYRKLKIIDVEQYNANPDVFIIHYAFDGKELLPPRLVAAKCETNEGKGIVKTLVREAAAPSKAAAKAAKDARDEHIPPIVGLGGSDNNGNSGFEKLISCNYKI